MATMFHGMRFLGLAFVLGVAASTPAMAMQAAPLTTWDFGGSSLQYISTSPMPAEWTSYPLQPSIGATPLDEGLKIYGTDADRAFSLTGASYIPGYVDNDFRGNQLVISGTGTIDGIRWQHPSDYIKTAFTIGWDFSGGILDVYKVETTYLLFDASDGFLTGVGSLLVDGFGTYEPGDWRVQVTFEDRFGQDYQMAQTIQWTITLGLDWTDQAPDDTLDFSISQNSIDIQALPEPTSLLLLLAAAGVRLRRR